MIDTKKIKTKLENELKLVEGELNSLGRKNPSNPKDWEATETDLDSDSADTNEVADEIEEYEENTAILKQLEIQYNDIKEALEKIKKRTYGKCEVCGEEIPENRLEANPSARACMKHSK